MKNMIIMMMMSRCLEGGGRCELGWEISILIMGVSRGVNGIIPCFPNVVRSLEWPVQYVQSKVQYGKNELENTVTVWRYCHGM